MADNGAFKATIDFIPCRHLAGKTITLNKRPGGDKAGFAFYADADRTTYISGEPNNYDELNQDWQAALVHEAGMLDHPYSFDSPEQMETQAGRSDGFFTNRSEMTISYLATHGMRSPKAPEVPDAEETLVRLGY